LVEQGVGAGLPCARRNAARGGLGPGTCTPCPRGVPTGYPYDQGSPAAVWESCPCTPGCTGHLLPTCLVCRSNRAPALTNLPVCVYLGV